MLQSISVWNSLFDVAAVVWYSNYHITGQEGNFDMGRFISKEALDMLSYRSALGRSLKQISLRSTPLEQIL